MKTVYVLRIRVSDDRTWSEPDYYRRRKDRDFDEMMNRIWGSMRTWSYEERKTEEEISQLCD
jgi:hypothetical protein